MVPSGWEVKTLNDISKVTSGGTPSKKNPNYWDDGSIPWVRTTEVQNCVISSSDIKAYITEDGLSNSSAKLAPKGAILLAMIGQGKTRGQVALLDCEASTNQNCAVIMLNNGYWPAYYFNFLLSQYDAIRNLSNTAGQSNLSGGLVKTIKVPVPSFEEQRKIAKILSTWDKAIGTTEQLIANSLQHKKALMQQLLTGKKRLVDEKGNVFKGVWKKYAIGKVTRIYDGTHNTPKYTVTGIPFYSVEHLTSGNFTNTKFIAPDVYEKENKRVKLERNDILMTRIGDIGTAKWLNWEVKASFYVSLALIKANGLFDSNFLTHYINSRGFHRELWKRTIHVAFPKKINLGEISHCEIKLPPLPEQQKIAAVLSNADKEIELLQQQLADLKQEKKALMQQLLTGKKRVKVD